MSKKWYGPKGSGFQLFGVTLTPNEKILAAKFAKEGQCLQAFGELPPGQQTLEDFVKDKLESARRLRQAMRQ